METGITNGSTRLTLKILHGPKYLIPGEIWGFLDLGVPFWVFIKSGLQFFGVYLGVPLFREITIWHYSAHAELSVSRV